MPDDANAEVGKRLGGSHSMGAATVGVKADTSQVKAITGSFNELTTAIKKARTEFQGLIKDADAAAKAMKGTAGARVAGRAGGSGGGYLPPSSGSSTGGANNPSDPAGSKGGYITKLLGKTVGGGSGGGGGTVGGYMNAMMGAPPGPGGGLNKAAALQMAGQIGAAVTGTIDNRVNQNMGYALPADRLSLSIQQSSGMSQAQVMAQRKPLQNYKLGEGGTNALMTNQLRYGINANEQAAGMAALYTSSGFSTSANDLVNMQNHLTSAPVANRMFALTGGVNFNKMGGGVKDMFTGMKDLSKRMGLGNEKILKGAMQQGSFMRSNLSQMGMDAAEQDTLLQYANQNIQFKKKGGKGDYNPDSKKDQKRMGISENFAMQSEETKRLQGKRDETMYRDQAKAYAKLEKTNQMLISASEKLEHTMRDLISARTGSRGLQKWIGTGLKWAGAAAAVAAAVPTGGGSLALAAGLYGTGAVLDGGDGPPDKAKAPAPAPAAPSIGGNASDANDANIQIPTGGKNTKSLAEVKTFGSFRGLKPIMQDRLLRAFREHPTLGFGQGHRSEDQQKAMFLDRYRKTDKDTGIVYDGSNWEKVKGADAAPPGASMHEIGMAADLVGDLGWLQANASRFGLKTFATVNNEPWHVQPTEYPNSRKATEKTYGSGSDPSVSYESRAGSLAADLPKEDSASSGPTKAGGMSSASSLRGGGSSSGGGVLGAAAAMRNKGATSRSASLSKTGAPSGERVEVPASGVLSPEQIAQVAYNAGFRGNDLTNVVAIALRESHGRAAAHNQSTKTKDDSYGMWQINMLPKAQGPFMTKMGYTGSDLLDPNTAAKAVFDIYKHNNNSLGAWLTYRKGAGLDSSPIAKNMPAAIEATAQFGGTATPSIVAQAPATTGDPMPIVRGNGGGHSPSHMAGSGGSSVNIASSPTITMPMNFVFNGVPGDMDLKKIATQIRNAIKSQTDIEMMRSL